MADDLSSHCAYIASTHIEAIVQDKSKMGVRRFGKTVAKIKARTVLRTDEQTKK